jgi:hypothetical protein
LDFKRAFADLVVTTLEQQRYLNNVTGEQKDNYSIKTIICQLLAAYYSIKAQCQMEHKLNQCQMEPCAFTDSALELID